MHKQPRAGETFEEHGETYEQLSLFSDVRALLDESERQGYRSTDVPNNRLADLLQEARA